MPHKCPKARLECAARSVRRRHATATLTADELRAQLIYDEEAGAFFKRGRPRNQALGKRQGEYWAVYVNGRYWKAHHLVILYVHGRWPTDVVDHINGDTVDNRLSNLRECKQADNVKAARRRRDNSSGVKGVSFCNRAKKWVAYIQHDKRHRFLGYYREKDHAVAARVKAAAEIFKDFQRDEG